jgi:hypothetical protein
VLVGVIDRYAIGHTPDGPIRTVIVTEGPTGVRVRLWLSSMILLSLFAQHQPCPGERIGVRYRWRDLDNGYHRWMLVVDRPEILDFSPLGGEVSDEVPWQRKRDVAIARLELVDTVSPGRTADGQRAQHHDRLSTADAVQLVTSRAAAWVPPSHRSIASQRAETAILRGVLIPLATVSESATPWKLGRPSQRPSEAITVVSPMRKLVCMTLYSEPGGTMPGGGGSGLSLKRMSIVTSAPSTLR